MRELLLSAALLLPAPSMAMELWCMPTKICHGSKCKSNTDEEVSVRIKDPDGPNPTMRAFAEDVPMKQTVEDGDIIRWTGSNEFQITMILDLDTSDMTYTMTSKLLANDDSLFFGKCEVQ
jgi:hypothetical protein